jgi:hypothetical protein
LFSFIQRSKIEGGLLSVKPMINNWLRDNVENMTVRQNSGQCYVGRSAILIKHFDNYLFLRFDEVKNCC